MTNGIIIIMPLLYMYPIPQVLPKMFLSMYICASFFFCLEYLLIIQHFHATHHSMPILNILPSMKASLKNLPFHTSIIFLLTHVMLLFSHFLSFIFRFSFLLIPRNISVHIFKFLKILPLQCHCSPRLLILSHTFPLYLKVF